MSDVVLAVDAGTRGAKALLFDRHGVQVGMAHADYELAGPGADLAELKSHVVLRAVQHVIRSVADSVDTASIRAVGVSAQLGFVAVDRQGQPLTAILTWMDRRAARQAERIQSTLGPRIYEVTGRRVSPEFAACKMLWLLDEQPDIYNRTYRFLTVKDLIVHELTGECVVDETQAGYSLLFDVTRRRWDARCFAELGLDQDKMPRVASASQLAGHLRSSQAAQLGLPPNIPVVVGGPDGTVASLGAGLVNAGQAVNVIGTTDVVFVGTDNPVFDPQQGTLVNCHAIPDLWLAGGPLSTTGGCVNWFRDQFLRPDQSLSEIEADAARLPPGADGLICIPSLTGERTPYWNPHMRGAFIGLTLHHQAAHAVRAILEGSAYATRQVFEVLQQQGVAIEQVLAVGGGATSDLWTQIRANVFKRPVVRPRVSEATGLGSALLAGFACGWFASFEEAAAAAIQVDSVINPVESDAARYDEAYERYVDLHRALS